MRYVHNRSQCVSGACVSLDKVNHSTGLASGSDLHLCFEQASQHMNVQSRPTPSTYTHQGHVGHLMCFLSLSLSLPVG